MQDIRQSKLLIFQELFIIFYITVLFAIEVMNLYSLIVLGVVALVAVAYVFTDFFFGKRSIFKTYNIDILVLFLAVNIISIIINFKYGFKENILCLFTLFVDYFILYNMGSDKDEKQVQSLFKIITHYFLLLYTAAVLFSLMGYVMRHSNAFYIGERLFRHGFVENRLFGIFPDPNYASVVSMVLAMICLYYLFKSRDIFIKTLYGIGVFLHLCYIILSGSRTAVLAILVSVMLSGYFFIYRKTKNKDFSTFKKQAVCLLTAITLAFVCYEGIEVLRIGLGYLPVGISYVQGDKKAEPISLVREDVEESEDYSNNRIKIWKSAFTIFKQKPLLGTSPRNLVSYAEHEFPTNYIAISKYMVHNSVFETMVFSGLMGLLLLMIFIFSCAYHTFKHLYQKTEEHFAEVLLGTAVIVSLMVSSMTLSALFYNRGAYNTLFWISIGFLMYYVRPKQEESNTLKIANKLFKRRKS